MTDTTAEPIENEALDTGAPVEDTSSDDARYAALAEKYADKVEPEREPAEEPKAEEAPKREPLAPEELDKRYRQAQAALREERQKRREAEERAAKAQPAQSEADELMEAIAALRDDDEDPIEDIATVKKALKIFRERQEAERTQEVQSREQQSAFQRFSSHVTDSEAEFREENPDYDDAQTYFKKTLRAELEGLGLDGEELDQEFTRQVLGVAQKAIEKGKSPAEVVYNVAKLRGYKTGDTPKAKEPAPVKTESSEAVDKVVGTIQTLQKSQQASKSLSSVGGSGAGGKDISIGHVSQMKGPKLREGYKALMEQAKRNGTFR